MIGGFLKSHRKMLDNPLFKGRVHWLGAWVWLFHRACWKPTKFNMSGKTITLERGQLAASLTQLEVAWGMSRKQIRHFLTRLEMGTMIETQKGTAGTIITICNYDLYQGDVDEQGTADDTPEGTVRAHQGHTKERREEGKKSKRKREPVGSPKKPTRLSEDWTLPKPWGEWAVGEGLHEQEVRDQADVFRDYWISAPGPKGVKLDWQATWRNWMRKYKRDRATGRDSDDGGEIKRMMQRSGYQ